MKALPFKIVKLETESFKVQEEKQSQLYDKLHTHPELQLTTIFKGSGTLIAGNYVGHFSPGDIFILGSDLPHVFHSDRNDLLNDENTNHVISIFIRPDLFKVSFKDIPEIAGIKLLMEKSTYGIRLDKASVSDILPLTKTIPEEIGVSRLSALLNILDRCAQGIHEAKYLNTAALDYKMNDTEGKRMDDIISFSTGSFHRLIKIEEVAEIAHMSTNAFCRYFKKRTRKSYIAFLNELRIDHSYKLLRNKELPISQVAFMSGFNNITNFNRVFRKTSGTTPREYRKGVI